MGSLFAAAGSIFSRYTGASASKSSTPPDSKSEANSATAINDHASTTHDTTLPTLSSTEPEEESPETTPKASASNAPPPVLAVPTLSLDEGTTNNDSNAATPSAPTPRGLTQKTTSANSRNETATNESQKPLMPPPPVPQTKQQTSTTSSTNTSSLMPPPSVPRLQPTGPPRLNAGSSLRPPPSAAAGLRAPPTNSGSRLSNSTLAPVPVKKSSASRKVVLEPGYSPLDWAALAANPKNQLRGANMPPGYLRVTPSMLKVQNGRKNRDAWTSYQGKVYNIQPYVPYHPGGKGELLRGAGKDSAKLFQEIHPWVNWDGILSECLVGILVSENDAQAEEALDAMD
ncbi:hypothetical protein PENSTE_c003G02594 [Penicillium steckii]|uniref:Cytochrome b5 heme-binding domain-containing protein n=1 Tax=Penicillium steckii TaxID=303698 RepID=A0A1V6TRJ6_9EURO|nr:hypothetical protein PENSTE_c003G02594 [Penicillium steckii]